MSKSKATVFTKGEAVNVNFDNYSSSDVFKIDEEKSLDVDSLLLVFNSFEEQLRDNTKNTDNFIAGLASEVNTSLTKGGLNCFCSTFESAENYDRMNLPYEFSTLDEDLIFNHKEIENLKETISKCPKLNSIKIVGVLSSEQLNDLVDSFENIEADLDSDYLVVV